MKDEIVIVGSVVESTRLPAVGAADDPETPIALYVDVEERLTPSALSIPDRITLIIQWETGEGVRLVEEGTPWLSNGDRVFTSLLEYSAYGGREKSAYSRAGPWTTYRIVDDYLDDSFTATSHSQNDHEDIQATPQSELATALVGKSLSAARELINGQ
ncbi:hypothetical protein ACQBAT_15150 [Ornithinimicrobium sp. Y1847]|uniref:hypothetical protein n=1 Tax=Ornithinimicrobium sp. Y1847 TaxID=3405419 RepID=UPI003B671905